MVVYGVETSANSVSIMRIGKLLLFESEVQILLKVSIGRLVGVQPLLDVLGLLILQNELTLLLLV